MNVTDIEFAYDSLRMKTDPEVQGIIDALEQHHMVTLRLLQATADHVDEIRILKSALAHGEVV